MGLTIKALVQSTVIESEICRQIDQPGSQCLELGNSLHSMSMRQTEKQHVALIKLIDRHKLKASYLAQIRVYTGDKLPGMPLRGDLADFNLRMK